MNGYLRKKILLADNSEEYRRSLFGYLDLEEYDYEEAGTPELAFEMLASEEFDLALVDLRMRDDNDPNDMRGLEIAKRAASMEIPCIIVTAFPTVELARKAMRSVDGEPYAKDVITKAGGIQPVVDLINRILRPKTSETPKRSEEGYRYDPEEKLLRKDGMIINLSRNQHRFIAELEKKNGGVNTYAELIAAVYRETLSDEDAVNDTRLKKLVDRTKKKIGDTDSSGQYIETVPGRGYRKNKMG